MRTRRGELGEGGQGEESVAGSQVDEQEELTVAELRIALREMRQELQSYKEALSELTSLKADAGGSGIVAGGVSQNAGPSPPQVEMTEAGESAGDRGGRSPDSGDGRRQQQQLPRPPNPESFDGTPSKLQDFVLDVELWAAGYPQASMAEKVLSVGQFLKGPAKECYRDMMRQARAAGKGPADFTLVDVLTTLQKRFGSVTEEIDAWQELKHASQGGETAAAWAARLRRLCAKPGMAAFATEDMLMRIYRSGLKRELQQVLLHQNFSTLLEIAQAATMAEKLQQRFVRREQPPARWRSRRPARFNAMQADGDAEEEPGDWHPETEQDADPEEAGLAAMHGAPMGRGAGRGRPGPGGGGHGAGRGRGRGYPPRAPPPTTGNDEIVPGRSGRTKLSIVCYSCKRRGHFEDDCPAGLPNQEN